MTRNTTTNPDTDEFTDSEINRLTQGTLVDGDTPDRYSDPSERYDEYFNIFDAGMMINEPDASDTTFTIHPEGVPERGTPSIDFFYGRPVLYLYTPLSEDVQYMIALPIAEDPQLRPLKTPGRRFEGNIEKVENEDY